MNLNLQTVTDESVSETVRSVETLSKDQYTKYQKAVILDGTSSIHDPMKRNAHSLFRRPVLKTKQCTSAALVHLLPVNTVSTLDEYASIVFVPHITVQLQESTRVDLVWDSYVDNSIKASTRQK